MSNEILSVLKKIETSGFKAYVIGGFVRDKLLGKSSYDVDIATDATPQDLVKIFSDKEFKDFKYGNISFKDKKYSFDITTFRKDYSYVSKRKPSKIDYVKTLEEDIVRRDFTINAIAMDKDCNIIDLVGGRADLKKKVLRTILDSDTKIKEDALRILRAVRFSTVLGFRLDDKLKKSIISNKDILKDLSFSRKKEELDKIFNSPNKRRGIKLIKKLNLVEALQLKNIDNVLRTNYPEGMWATITEANYPFNKHEQGVIKRVNMLMNEDINSNLTLYKYDLYVINIVCDLKRLNKAKITKKYNLLPIKSKKDIDIKAEDIIAIIGDNSSALGAVYDDLVRKILLLELVNEKDKIKAYLKYKYL